MSTPFPIVSSSAQANYAQHFGFKRVAVHHVTLAPGERSSMPHAESLEEEFAYVLEGTVHMWINGYIQELTPGWAAGFPAGTGIAHTFINNSLAPVRLLVAGERTKKENLCAFPLNPEMKTESDIWWEDYPPQKLGPHDGTPGPVAAEAFLREPAPCTAYAPGLERRKPFNYPGDSETFDEGVRLSNLLGLKALGIWYQVLPPDRRSSYPHAHTHEEEFAYILEGRPHLWVNGSTRELAPRDAVGFAGGTGTTHTLINDSRSPVTYLGIGESAEFPDEKILYPLAPLRTREMIRGGWHWADAPAWPMGPHDGRPRAAFPDHLRLRLCGPEDAVEVLRVLATAPAYFRNVEGREPSLETARSEIVSEPPKKHARYFKEFLLIELNGAAVGAVDLHAHHPEEGITYVGLLLLDERHHGRGLGRRCYELVEQYARHALGAKSKIRLGVSDDNECSGFWKKMGFAPNGRTYTWQGEAKTSNVVEYDKDFTPPRS